MLMLTGNNMKKLFNVGLSTVHILSLLQYVNLEMFIKKVKQEYQNLLCVHPRITCKAYNSILEWFAL